MPLKTLLTSLLRTIGVVLVFFYTIGTILAFVGVISIVNYLGNTTRLAFLGWPIVVNEKRIIEEES
jgi:hypothetical protein